MIKKVYLLKKDTFYLNYYITNEKDIKTGFISDIGLSSRDYKVFFDRTEAQELANLIFIATGIMFEIEEREATLNETI